MTFHDKYILYQNKKCNNKVNTINHYLILNKIPVFLCELAEASRENVLMIC